ncbi:NRPS-like enzyme [Aspergillus tubingensis]|uniref:NRPS-like enzyme n=1 Tax=Aspergillus tubingensis TaxID=5068 RepID=UPI0015789CD0|nr:NRPS-like enzyme [Aspergillus tubingensis]GFN18907.1 NRPS-like enzyme [Aspergillus tubingensis]
MTVPDASQFDPRTQLLPHIVDHYAKVKPDAIYAEYPVSLMSYDDGYRPITFKAFANAINGIAWWLTEKLGPGDGETLAYVGPNDLRYPALILGAVKAGYRMFLTSPRNSVAAHSSLFNRLSCTKLVTPVPHPPPVKAILEGHTLDILEVPSVDELISKEYAHFEFSKTYPEAAGEVLAVIHTSGSTGIPKPIFWTHDTACKHMHTTVLDPPRGHESQDSWLFGKRIFLVPPPFHAAGLAYSLFITIPVGTTVIFPASGGLPTAASLVEARKKTQIDVLLGVPSIIQEFSQSPELLDYCSKHLERLVYCGGDLPQPIGDAVASKIRLMNLYGASEVGMISTIHSKTDRDPRTDWRYLHINPRMGAELRHVADQYYELVIVRSPRTEKHQLTFTVFPDQQEYHTKDLFVRHPDPSKPDLWRWAARVDDVIVFLNGEKTNPVSMEQHIAASNPEVTAVLVAGARRFQASLLVEIGGKDLSAHERAAMIEKLWPSIQEANAVCPAHARVAKTHILFTKPDKPMLRAGKGTIQRAASLELYTSELDALYADADKLSQTASNGEPAGPGQVDDPKFLSDYIRRTINYVTGWDLTNTQNFFELGLDSLQAITATRAFKKGLDLPTLTPNLIYLHPSVDELTQAVLHLQQHEEASTEERKEAQLQQRYLLDTLLQSPSVDYVHCLNRTPYAGESHRVKHGGMKTDLSRASFWTADLSQPDLGLGPDVFKTLRNIATLIIHNAWAVNFNLSLSSFKPNLTGVVNLINFAAQSHQSPHLFFLSSISSTMGHYTKTGLTPEEVITTTTPGPNGYADSKYLAEQLLAQAARQGRLHASFARVGQIAGPVRSKGIWNKTEWFPSLVLSSYHLGVLPDTLGPALNRIDWVPVDLLAEVLVDLAVACRRGEPGSVQVYHPVNLHPVDWEVIRPVVAEAIFKISRKTIKTVPFTEWVQRVRQDLEMAGGTGERMSDEELQKRLAKNPAAKLLEFFEGIMSQTERVNVLDTKLTGQVSEKLRAVDAVKPEWMNVWVEEWVRRELVVDWSIVGRKLGVRK